MRTPLLAALFALATAGAAHAQATLDVVAPDTISPHVAFDTYLAYTFEGGLYEDLVIAFDIPANARFINGVMPNTFTGDCATNAEGPRTCTFTAATLDVAGGVSGVITVAAETRRFAHLNGEPLPLTAHITGTYTPPAGGPAALDVPPATAAPLVTGVAAAGWQSRAVFNRPSTQYWGVGPDGDLGYFFLYDLRPRNDGRTPFAAGATLTVTLGADVQYIDHFSATNNNAEPTTDTIDWVVPTPPTPGAWGATITATAPLPSTRPNFTDNPSYYPHLHVVAFIPCDHIPTGTDLAAYGLDATFDAVEHLYDPELPPIPYTLTGAIPNPPATVTSGGACGEGFIFSKARGTGSSGVGTEARFTLSATPPKGVVPLEHAIIVDRLPPGHVGARVTYGGGGDAGFTAWTCDLPGVETISAADFVTTYQDDACHLIDTPDAPAVPTHVVLWNASWGGGDEPQTGLVANVHMTLPLDYLAAGFPQQLVNTATFAGWGEGDLDPDSGQPTVLTFTGQDADALDIYDGAVPFFRHVGGGVWTTNPPVLAPGQQGMVTFQSWFNTNLTPPRNPSITVTLPDEVTLDQVESLPVNNSTCGGPAPEPSLGDLDGQTLTVRWGSAAEPYMPPRTDCVRLRLTFTLNDGVPLIDGDQFTFTAFGGADAIADIATDSARTTSATFTAAVPPELRSEATATCDDANQPVLGAFASNTGGVTLEDVVITLVLPRVTDGASTGDATFVGLRDVPAGAPVEYEVAGTWQPSPPADLATITAVRATVASLAPLADPVGFTLDAATSAHDAALYPRATASSSVLSPADSGLGAPFRATHCVGVVQAGAFWDRDADGAQGDPGLEPWLADWTFTLRDADEAVVASFASSAAGADATGVTVPTGAYTLVATPAAGDVSWSATAGALSRAVNVEGAATTTEVFGVGCVCAEGMCDEDGDRCVACLAASDCAAPTDLCLEATCDDGACVDVSRGVTCDTPGICEEPGFCDPDTGACSYEARECAPTPIFLVVRQGATPVGSVRCEVNGDQILCDMRDEGGEQVLDVQPHLGVCGG